jgi:hypothetical protein
MERVTNRGLQRMAIGWIVFVGGLALLLWLHTFRDHAAHSAIVPVFLFLWVVLGVCVWDGRNAVAPRFRVLLFSLQGLIAVLASALFFHHLLHAP